MRVVSTSTCLVGLLLLASMSVAACSKESSLSCGEGTVQEGDLCAPDPEEMGGEGGLGGSSTAAPEKEVVIIDRDGRNDTQKLVEAEFKGALAGGPISETALLVVWKPLDIVGLTYNIYVATNEDDLSFGRPQYMAPQGADSLEIQGLNKGKTYFIAVVPVLDGIELDVRHEVVEAIPKADSKSPSFAGVDQGRAADGAAVRLSWESATDNLSPAELIRYYVYVGTEPDFAEKDDAKALRSPFAVSAPGATSLLVSGLPLPETEYYFVVRARDAAGNLDDNIGVVSAVSGEDQLPPTFSGCDSATTISASIVEVTWKAALDDIAEPDDISYNFYVSKTPDGHNLSEPSYTVTGGTSAEIPGLDRATTYHIICRAADPTGNEEENNRSNSATTKEDGSPPVFGGITATANLAATSIDLQWAEAEDDQTATENITYLIYVSTTSGSFDPKNDLRTKVTGLNAVTIPDLLSNTPYFLTVLAQDEAGNFSETILESSITTLVSLRADIEIPIFSNKCATSGCHAGATAAAQLNLSQGWSFNGLVNAEAKSAAGLGMKIVVPLDPDTSHLVQRIESTDVGSKMPQDPNVFLSQAEIDTIRAWIIQGANDN